MRTDYISSDTIGVLLWALTPADKLICEIMLQTGWRVDDVLELRTEQLVNARGKKRHQLTIIEKKTGKKSKKSLPGELLDRVIEQSGRVYAFQHRDDYRKHRTRQAVFADLKRVAKKFNIKINLAPHSLRKNYAVYIADTYGLSKAQEELNHDNPMLTAFYCMSRELTERHK